MAQNIVTQIIIEALYKDKVSGPAKDAEKKLTATFNNIQKALGISIGAYSLKQLADFALQTARLAGENDNLRQSYENLAQTRKLNADLMLGKMQAASNNTINSMELMKQANNAMLLGLPVTENEMALLTEAGYKLGKAMGVDAAKGLESLTVGIGRQSRLWLDNLGIVIDAEAGNKKYADSLGKTAGQLTEAEKKTAFYNSAIEQIRVKLNQLGPVQETATDKIAQANKQVLEAKIALGELFAPAVSSVSGALGRLAKAVGVELRDAFEVYKDESDRVFTANQNQYSQILQISSILDDYARKEKLTADELKHRHDLVNQLKTISPAYFSRLDAEKSKYEDIKTAIGLATDELVKKIRIEAAQKTLADSYSKIIGLQAEQFEITAKQAQIEADLQNYWKDNQASLRLFNMTISEFNNLSPDQQKGMIENARASALYEERIRQINSEIKNFNNEIKYVIESQPDMKSFFEALGNKPAVSPGTNEDLEKLEEQILAISSLKKTWGELATFEPIKTPPVDFSDKYIDQLRAFTGLFNEFSSNIGQAVVYGQKLGPAVVSSLRAIEAQLASKIILYGLAALFTGGTSATAGLLTGGKATSFLGYLFGGGFAEGGVATGPQSGYLAKLHGTEAIIPLKPNISPSIPNNIFNFDSNSKIERQLSRLTDKFDELAYEMKNIKYSVQIGDREIYASNERVASSRRRTIL